MLTVSADCQLDITSVTYTKSTEAKTGNIKPTAHRKKIVAKPMIHIKDNNVDTIACWVRSPKFTVTQFLRISPKPALWDRLVLHIIIKSINVITSKARRKASMLELSPIKNQAKHINT